MNKKHSKDEGQILVMIVFALFALLGFTALAIDGGSIYHERRRAQNGADASSMAGAGQAALSLSNSHMSYGQWDCSDARVIQAENAAINAAINRATTNDFTIDYITTDHNGVETQCGVYDNGSYVEKYIDVTTYISTTVNALFSQFIFNKPLQNQVVATARVRPPSPLAYGYAIFSHREDCPNSNTGGVHFNGNSTVTIDGGGVFSNACMKVTGSSLSIDVDDGSIRYVTDYSQSGHPDIDPDPEQGPVTLPDESWQVPPPNCNAVPPQPSPSNTGNVTITPGRYPNIRHNNGVLTLEPGLYCLSGDFDIRGDVIVGDGVTIYLSNGDFDIAGGAEVHLNAPPDGASTTGIPGILIYLPVGNDGEVSLKGNADSWYVGAVYAADPGSTVEVGGTGSQLETYHTQLIGGTVFVHGDATIDINFDEAYTYQKPAAIDLYR